MVIDGQWVDDEEWLEQQSQAIYEAIQRVKAAGEAGDIPACKLAIFEKYVNHYATFRAPDQFWNSSSAYC